MNSFPSSEKEIERLLTLRDYNILDTASEAVYDQLTELASSICEAPIALISIIDEHREWFKSAYGVNIVEKPRGWLPLIEEVKQDKIIEIQDSRKEQYLDLSTLKINDINIIFYASISLFSPCGKHIGFLYVIDNKTHKLNIKQKQQLTLLSKQVVSLLELRKNSSHSNSQSFENSKEFEQKNKQLEQFVYTVSHDLKAPLVTLSAFTKTLGKELSQYTTDKQKYRFTRIEENISQMGNLLTELLELSRVLNQDVTKELIDTQQVIEKQKQQVSKQYKDVKFTVEIVTPLNPVFANKVLFTQCIFNLLTYSIENRDPSRTLNIKISTHHDQEYTSVSIEDNGLGISEKVQKRIFCVFEQVDQVKETGMGLCIVKAVLDKHHGKIKLNSTLGKGTQFELFFPVETKK